MTPPLGARCSCSRRTRRSSAKRYIYIYVCVCAHKGCQVHTVKVARGLQAATLCARGCNPMPASLPPHSGARAARARPAHAQLRLGQPGQARAAGRVERAELHLQGCACALHVHCMCTACALHVHCMCTACALHVHCPHFILGHHTHCVCACRYSPPLCASSQAHGTRGLWSCCLGPSRL